jgi:antitoxin ParD1/3/4
MKTQSPKNTMRPVTISLSPQQVERLNTAVESGAYASSSEVIREALRLWEQREEMRALEIARLKQAYEEGLASGEPVDGSSAMSKLRSELFGSRSERAA